MGSFLYGEFLNSEQFLTKLSVIDLHGTAVDQQLTQRTWVCLNLYGCYSNFRLLAYLRAKNTKNSRIQFENLLNL